MPYEVRLPDIGEGVAEGEIVRWLVKPGDPVREDQPLVEVMTDKASVEIPSPRAGTIAVLHAEEGQVLPVGSVIVTIALAGDAVGAGASPTAGAPRAERVAGAAIDPIRAPATATAAAPAGRIQATPAVRQLAKQLGVSLETLSGSGPGGAVTAEDVRRATGSTGGSGSAAPAGRAVSAGARPAATTVGDALGAGSRTASPGPAAGPEERVPLRGLRRTIAEHTRRSLDTAAHFTFVAECDMTALVEHREGLRPRAEAAGVRLTYLSYVLKALVDSLSGFPMLNASLDDERGEIVIKRYYHIGVATHTEEGLIVPVVRHVDRLSLFAVAREIDRLSTAARAGRLKLEELQGGTFTVTSTGARGGVLATPILHHPQVAILGVHEIRKRPAVVEDRIVPRDLGNLSLSLDHRVVDGAVGADFLYDLIHRLEHPADWLPEGALA